MTDTHKCYVFIVCMCAVTEYNESIVIGQGMELIRNPNFYTVLGQKTFGLIKSHCKFKNIDQNIENSVCFHVIFFLSSKQIRFVRFMPRVCFFTHSVICMYAKKDKFYLNRKSLPIMCTMYYCIFNRSDHSNNGMNRLLNI